MDSRLSQLPNYIDLRPSGAVSPRTAQIHASASFVPAVVRADGPANRRIHVSLEFPIVGPTAIWAAARDETLKYVDIA